MRRTPGNQQSLEEECFGIVRTLFRSEGYVREWMGKEIPAFGYLTPVGYAQAHGLTALREQVARIKHMDSA
jgi:hypothetical protein